MQDAAGAGVNGQRRHLLPEFVRGIACLHSEALARQTSDHRPISVRLAVSEQRLPLAA